jgi:hypothetical protein
LALTFAGACAEDPLVSDNAGTEAEFESATGPVSPEVEVTSALLSTPPAKFTGWITVWDDPHGTWRQESYCNNDWYAIGFKQRVEGKQGSGDDTALNSVVLRCKQKTGPAFEEVSSYDGNWGAWGSEPICPGGDYYSSTNFVNGARLKVEGGQGSGDDTSANAAQMTCTAGGTLSASNDGPWGGWQSWNQCPAGQAACGIRIKFEGSQGGGDDTAMNGLKLACCTL